MGLMGIGTTGSGKYGASLVALAGSLLILVLLSAAPAWAQDGDCPGAEVVEEVNGNGNKQSPPFDIEGEFFRITYDVRSTGNPEFLFFDIVVEDEDDTPVAIISQEQEGEDSSFVNESPGQFSLDVASANAEYEITVEDCPGTADDGGGASEDQYSDDDTDAADDDTDAADDDTDDIVDDTVPDKPLPNTGGMPLLSLLLVGFALAGTGLSILRFGIRRDQ